MLLGMITIRLALLSIAVLLPIAVSASLPGDTQNGTRCTSSSAAGDMLHYSEVLDRSSTRVRIAGCRQWKG